MSLKKRLCKVCRTPLIEGKNWTKSRYTLLCSPHWSIYTRKYVKKYEVKNNKTDKRKKQMNETAKRMLKKYPEKGNARAKLRYAVKTGKIIKPKYCERLGHVCSNFTKIQGHHYAGYDADNWKRVIWLCSFHHAEEHSSIKRMGLNINL